MAQQLLYLYTPDQVLQRGLQLAAGNAWNPERLMNQKRETLIEDFTGYYGAHPVALSRLWFELQNTPVAATRIDVSKKRSVHLKNFLRANHFLKCYPTETIRKLLSGNSKKTVRKWCWYFVDRIAAQRQVKIVWPDDNEWTSSFIISVDGVQCHFHEVKHPTLSKDPNYFAWKHNGPGLGYEIGLHLFESRVVWLRKANRTKDNDRVVYDQLLRHMIPMGKKVVADRGYRKADDPNIATPNEYDDNELKVFKARARMRQEAFHSRLKCYRCLSAEFRHGEDRHARCFEAICVIKQYEMELVSPLFDV